MVKNLPLVHVEVRKLNSSFASTQELKQTTVDHLRAFHPSLSANTKVTSFQTTPFLAANIEMMEISDIEGLPSSSASEYVSSVEVDFHVHVYALSQKEMTGMKAYEDDEVCIFSQLALPSRDLADIWENLVFEDDCVKQRLLKYVETSLLFADKHVNTAIIAINRVILLQGPPGTGKTSLCKALAQKVAVRMSDRYTHGHLIEVNAQSVFSKFFSESGRILTKMFESIQDLVKDRTGFVCILIDEVESLAASRSSALKGSEPTDTIRVVNVLLTQIDKLRKEENCFILTTSNLTESIDIAFVDRADVKYHIGLPCQKGIYTILASCTAELSRAGLIYPPVDLLETRAIAVFSSMMTGSTENIDYSTAGDSSIEASRILWKVCYLFKGKSGRNLRKAPFLAFSAISTPTTTISNYLEMLASIATKDTDN